MEHSKLPWILEKRDGHSKPECTIDDIATLLARCKEVK